MKTDVFTPLDNHGTRDNFNMRTGSGCLINPYKNDRSLRHPERQIRSGQVKDLCGDNRLLPAQARKGFGFSGPSVSAPQDDILFHPAYNSLIYRINRYNFPSQ